MDLYGRWPLVWGSRLGSGTGSGAGDVVFTVEFRLSVAQVVGLATLSLQ